MATKLLALHGFTGLGTDFKPFSELVKGVTWHCPNMPGHGPKPLTDCSPEAVLDFIQTETRALQPPASAIQPQASGFRPQPSALRKVLLGYSMGARAALLHAVSYPQAWDRLILISPNPGIEDETARAQRRLTDERLAARIERHGVAAFLEFWQNTPLIRIQKTIRSDWLEPMQAQRQTHQTTGLAASLRMFGQGHCPNLWPRLEGLTMPVLLITGRKDPAYTEIARRMTGKLPNAKWVEIEDAGHMPHLESPTQCAAEIQQFLSR